MKKNKVTIRNVAEEAGVSVTLVSFVMNAKQRPDGSLDCPVNPKTAARVKEVAARLGYRKNVAAASLRSGRSNTIAVIPTDMSNKFFAGISRCIEDKAQKDYNYTTLFASSDEDAKKLGYILDTVNAHNIDGVILAPCEGSKEAIQKLLDYRIPTVLIDRNIEGIEGVGKVLLDDFQAGYDAAQLLISKGLKKIEMISYSLGISSFTERETGYRKAMEEAGLAGFAKIHTTTYATASTDIPKIITDAVKRGVEAFFLPTYSLSAQVMKTMKDNGYKTPDDLALVCFDVSDIYELYETTVTHLIQPLKELGEKAVEVLGKMIENNEPGETVILKPEMILGGSTENIGKK